MRSGILALVLARFDPFPDWDLDRAPADADASDDARDELIACIELTSVDVSEIGHQSDCGMAPDERVDRARAGGCGSSMALESARRLRDRDPRSPGPFLGRSGGYQCAGHGSEDGAPVLDASDLARVTPLVSPEATVLHPAMSGGRDE